MDGSLDVASHQQGVAVEVSTGRIFFSRLRDGVGVEFYRKLRRRRRFPNNVPVLAVEETCEGRSQWIESTGFDVFESIPGLADDVPGVADLFGRVSKTTFRIAIRNERRDFL